MKKIEVGDIIFSNIYNLCGAFDDYETDAQKIFFNNYLSELNGKNRDLLVKLKYLGNGIFEEELTGEKILCVMDMVFLNKDWFKLADVEKQIYNPVIGYDDFCEALEYGDFDTNITEISKIEYMKLLSLLIKKYNKYPLLAFFLEESYSLTEESENKYHKYDQETIKNMVYQIKEFAKEETEDTVQILYETLSDMLSLDEKIEMIDDEINKIK